MSLRKISLTAPSLLVLALAAAVCIGFAPVPASAESISKDQVNSMIHDYIMNNPQVLMESVDNYQKKMMADRQANAVQDLKKNKSTLVSDINSPEAGNPKGDVTVIEFFDYNCHFCKGAFPAVQALLDKDKKVRVVFKEFPILGPTSETAARWALAANMQKKYFAFHAAMMNNKEPITDELLAKVAKSVGMDVDKAKADVTSADVGAEIAKNRALADQLDINGTPAFIIGDNISRGAIPEEAIEDKIKSIRAAKK